MEEENSSVSGPPLMARSKWHLLNELTTESGPAMRAKRLGEKFVPKGSPFRRPSGEAPSSAACHR